MCDSTTSDLIPQASSSVLFCAFPCLQSLAVDCSGIHSSKSGVDLPIPSTLSLSPHLRELELNCIGMDAVLDWFLSLPDRPALRSVGLRPIRRNNSATIAKLLKALENSLETFLISTAVVEEGTFVVFLSLIYAACQLFINKDTIGQSTCAATHAYAPFKSSLTATTTILGWSCRCCLKCLVRTLRRWGSESVFVKTGSTK